MKTILIDVDRCVQCCNCQIACKDEHCGNDWLPVATAQGKGQFWIRIDQNEVGSGTLTRVTRVPLLCQHCANPSCMAACPNGAITQRADGVVLIDPTDCEGCGACREACPYAAISQNAEAGISQKCTLCAHLLDNGWDRPRCVAACPSDALRFVDEDELGNQALAAPREGLLPEAGTEPRVRYLHLPKPFVGGSVYAPRENECVEGVCVTAVGMVSGIRYELATDNYGDFIIKDMEPGIYALTFEKEGYFPKTVSNLDVREPLNVGDIALYRKTNA